MLMKLLESQSQLIDFFILSTNQSNSREYIIFARASWLIVAEGGSRYFVTFPSWVAIMQEHNVSYSCFATHIKNSIIFERQIPNVWWG